MKDLKISRRTALAAAAAAPFVATAASTVRAFESVAAPLTARHSTFRLGDVRVTTLLSGTRVVTDDPQGLFGMNVDKAEFERVSLESFIPAHRTQFNFTPTLVQTATEFVLFDTGLSASSMEAALGQAGLVPADISIVVLTHMHGDHIGGMTTSDGSPSYPNARYVTGQVEFDYWTETGSNAFSSKVEPLAEHFRFIGNEGEVTPGITSIAAYGHTPGHMAYRIESAGEQLIILADTTNHYVWSLAYPDWECRFDMDKEAACASRRQLLGMLATERIPMIGYHMPFPGCGFVDKRSGGQFHYVPVTPQMIL